MSLKRFVAILWLLIVQSVTTVAQTIYVVSVGIPDYQNINDLNYTEAYVSLFNSIMAEYNAKIITLTESQATHANVIKTIRDVFSQAKPSDAVIFFF